MATTPLLYIPKVKYESASTSFATMSTLSLNGTSGLTISFWFYRTSVGTETLLYFGESGSSNIRIGVIGSGTSEYNMYLTLNNFPNNVFFQFNTINTWNHFAVTLTYSAGNTSTHKVYANGVLRSTTENLPYLTSTYSKNRLGHFSGYMDNFAVYDSVLSDADIETNYNTTLASLLPPPYVALWYSTKISLVNSNTEIFNGYFVVVKQNSSDTQGLITRFFDASNVGVDIIAYNNYYGADRVFEINTIKFSYNGTNIISFPYYKNLYSNSAFYSFWQHETEFVTGGLSPMNSIGNVLVDNSVKMINMQISGPPNLYVDPPASTDIYFPNINLIHVALNDTLATFISGVTVLPSVEGTLTFNKTNSSGATLTSSSVYDEVGEYTIFCTFTPTDALTYSVKTASFSIIVNKASTTTIFASPSPIVYGNTLSASLNTTASMPGTFDYFFDASFTLLVSESAILNAGTYTIYSRLTPTSANYSTSYDSKTLVVNKAATFLTFPNITSIVYGVTTGSTTIAALLNGTVANISGGIYNFSTNGTPITVESTLTAGTYTIYCSYTSQNDNYESCMDSITITIDAQSTSATYSVSTPTSIVYGTDLTTTMNATADLVQGTSLPGTIRYFTDASYNNQVYTSTILNFGTYTIYAVFTPTDTVNYLSSYVTTILSVTKVPTVITTSPQSIVYQTGVTAALTATVLPLVDGSFAYFYDNSYTDLILITNSINAGTYTVYTKFTPMSANYAISTANYQLTVTQKPTTITFPNVVDISFSTTTSYSTPLSSFIANTVADVSGTFTFTDASSNILTSDGAYRFTGQYPINAFFTPTSSNFASSVSTYSNLYVRFAGNFSFATTSATITYGTSLNNILETSLPTNEEALPQIIPGNTIYQLSNGTVVDNSTNLVPSTYAITARFVPTDSARYATIFATNTKTVVVNKKQLFILPGNVTAFLLSSPTTMNYLYTGLVLNDTSSNSVTFTNITKYYVNLTSSNSLSTVHALPKVSEDDVYNLGFVGNTKIYTTYLIINSFSSSKYTNPFGKSSTTINKRPILLSFNIPESVKTISYGTPLTSSYLSATITDTQTNAHVTDRQVIYTFSSTDMSQNVVPNSVLNSGTYNLFAIFVDASNIYMNGNTFSQRTNSVIVSKVKSTITTPSISSLVYGTTLDSFISGTTNSVPGSLKFYTLQ